MRLGPGVYPGDVRPPLVSLASESSRLDRMPLEISTDFTLRLRLKL